MDRYLHVFSDSFRGYARYLAHEITHPSCHNYLYWLLAISAVRKPLLRKIQFDWVSNERD